MLTKIKTYFILLVLLTVGFTFAQDDKSKLFDEYITNYLLNKNVPSISAGILKDGKILWVGAKGLIDIENNVVATKSSVYRIASITKPFTSVAIMQLWEKGLIDLDKDIRTYLPSFPEKKWKFTVRQLLNHTSGIRNYKEGEFHSKKFYSSLSEAVKVFSYDSLLFEPGTKYEYTSYGYNLLALIVEAVSKTSFESYINKNIFAPAGMKSTFIDKQRDIIPNRVKGYEKDFNRTIKNAPLADLSIKVGGGGLVSTADDLLIFAKSIYDEKLIKASTLDTMLLQTKLKDGKKINYGLGFSLSFSADSLQKFYHIGGGTGFSTNLVFYPKNKIAAVHLLNIVDRNLGNPADDIADIEMTGKVVIPKKPIADELMTIYQNHNIDSVLIRVNKIYKEQSDQFLLSETETIYFAKDLVGLNKNADAIIYLKELLKIYPKSFAIAAELGDTYMIDKNTGLALRYYRMAAQLNNKDIRINSLIKKLSGQK